MGAKLNERLSKGKGVFFKKAKPGAPNQMFGVKARRFVPSLLALGAIGVGIAKSKADEGYNLKMKTAVNGIMDTQGVAVAPGSINNSYTPVTGGGINNHGATGDVAFGMWNSRHTGTV